MNFDVLICFYQCTKTCSKKIFALLSQPHIHFTFKLIVIREASPAKVYFLNRLSIKHITLDQVGDVRCMFQKFPHLFLVNVFQVNRAVWSGIVTMEQCFCRLQAWAFSLNCTLKYQ